MKLSIFYLPLFFSSLCLTSCGTSLNTLKKIYAIGSDFGEVITKQKNNNSFIKFENYCFWNEGKYDVSIHCDKTFKYIDDNQFTIKKIGNSNDLNVIKKGDDIFKVVYTIGIPISYGTSGVESLLFNLNNTKGCRVYLYNDNSFLKVNSIEIFN